MAELGKTFDPTAHDTEQQEFDLIPTGKYRLEVIASDLRDDNGDKAITLQFGVIEPEAWKDRRIFGWIDYENKDAKKQSDGQRDLARLCRVVEHVGPLTNTDDLHLIAFMADVEASPAGVSKKTGNAYKAKNRIKKYYFPDEGNLPEPFVPEAGEAARPAAANQNTRPAANQNQEGSGRPFAAGGKPASPPAGGAPKRNWGQKAA
jgi:hypothetical protein